MVTLGDFYGNKFRSFVSTNVEKEINRIINLFPNDQMFVIETQYAPDYDDDGDYYSPKSSTKSETCEKITREIVESLIKSHKEEMYWSVSFIGEPPIQSVVELFDYVISYLQREISTKEGFFEQFNNFLGEGEYHNSKIQTKEAYEEKQRIAKRRQLEETAAAFVQQYNLEGIDTFEGMKILHDLINRQNSKREQFFSSECRSERYATYAMSGCRHTFWEDEDYTRNEFDGNLDKLYDLLCYVRDYFPLFWKEYQNHTLDEINADD